MHLFDYLEQLETNRKVWSWGGSKGGGRQGGRSIKLLGRVELDAPWAFSYHGPSKSDQLNNLGGQTWMPPG